MTIFDDCFINDDDLLEYTPKDWRYAIPQTIAEAKSLIKKTTITNESIQAKKQWIFENQLSVIEGIAEDNAEKNRDEISCCGYGVDGDYYYKICTYGYDSSIDCEIGRDEYEDFINGIDLLPETASDIITFYSIYSIYSIIEHIADSAFSTRYLYEEQSEYQDYLNNDKPILLKLKSLYYPH